MSARVLAIYDVPSLHDISAYKDLKFINGSEPTAQHLWSVVHLACTIVSSLSTLVLSAMYCSIPTSIPSPTCFETLSDDT